MNSCKLCKFDELEIVYQPSGSEIELQIAVCKHCGLVQGICNSVEYERINDFVRDENAEIQKLSCDAAYSDIRVGKQQMLPNAVELIEKYNLKGNLKRVLDMRAARGDFVNYLNELSPATLIDAIEPDMYMAKEIRPSDHINLVTRKYSDWNPDYKYNFIYSCHTLEHYRDPLSNLKYIWSKLEDNGYLILDVPNLEVVINTNNLDEYFYDKHLTYFTGVSLTKMMATVGFATIELNKDGQCLYGLFKKINNQIEPCEDQEAVTQSISLIQKYRSDIALNRKSVQAISNQIMNFLMENDSLVCFFGVGRLFDVFRTYGQLEIPLGTILVDNFLSKATQKLYGQNVFDQSALTEDVSIVILFTRTNEIAGHLAASHPHLRVYHWTEFS